MLNCKSGLNKHVYIKSQRFRIIWGLIEKQRITSEFSLKSTLTGKRTLHMFAGIELVRKALRIPAATIIQNTGIDATVVVEKIVNSNNNMGYDAMEGEMVDLMKSGIIDPTKVG